MVRNLPLQWALTVILLLGLNSYLNAQLSANLPLQTNDPQMEALLSPEVPIVTMPGIDLNPYIEEDLANDAVDKPWRFAVSIPVDLNMNNSGKWETLPNGDRIWRLHIRSHGAVSTNLLYKEFFLPKGATLHIYKPDKSQVRGAFTSNNNKEDRVFATALLKGESVVLEYYEPRHVKGQGVIHIGTFNHGYRGYGENNAAAGASGNCQNDVNCSSNTTWQIIKRAVGKWSRNGNTWCTGTLMNNTNLDCRPLFLTANHCMDGLTSLDYDAINNPGPFNTAIFYWNFETPGCNQSPQQNGDDTQTTNGIKLVLANPDLDGNYSSSSDFALFELDENPKSAYNVYFAGWDASGATGTGGAGIHHPAGDVKKISIHSLTPTSAVSDRYWRINPWDQVFGNRGVTEGGSSGSGLFRSNGRLIGQLFGSFSTNENCSDPINDTGDYGKLSYSWTNDGAADSRRRLNVHFDPVGSGATTIMNGSSNPCGMPFNVVCENALSISCGGSRTVNTLNATGDGSPTKGGITSCGNVNFFPDHKGVWYKYTGTGQQVTVSTNNATTDFDTKLAVFSGSCSNLNCVDGNDDEVFPTVTASTVKFVASPGVVYYIHLSGFAGATGTAKVEIDCCDLPEAKCKNFTLPLNAAGNATLSPAQVNNNSTFDCGFSSWNVNPSAFDCTNEGDNTVTLTVTDVCGNTSDCTANVFVDGTAADPPKLAQQNCGGCNQIRMFYCQFDPAPASLNDFIDGTKELNANYIAGNPLVWYNDAGGSQGGLFNGTGQEPPTPNMNIAPATYFYWVAMQNQVTGCIGDAIRVRVRVRKTPTPTFNTPPIPFCYGGQLDLAEWVDDPNNVTDKYDFYDGDPDGGGNLIGSVTATNGNVDPLNYVIVTPQVGNNTYWVVATNQGNNNTITCTAKASMTFPVAAPSTLAFIPNLTVNHGDNVSVPFFSPNATYIIWLDHYSFNNPNIGLMGYIGLGNLAFTAQNNTLVPVTAKIRVLTYLGNCAGQYRDFFITVNPASPGARQGRSNSLALAAYKLNLRDVRLAWDITYDRNLVYFEVERLKDGVDQSDDMAVILGMNNWEKIATVDYHTSQASYSYIDADGMSHATKYRLKLIHADGSVFWSEAVEVNFEFFDGDRFVVFPNPSDGHFLLRSAMPIADNWTYQISDALGRTIDQGNLKSEEQSFDIGTQPTGVYFLILHSPQGQRFIKRVVRK